MLLCDVGAKAQTGRCEAQFGLGAGCADPGSTFVVLFFWCARALVMADILACKMTAD